MMPPVTMMPPPAPTFVQPPLAVQAINSAPTTPRTQPPAVTTRPTPAPAPVVRAQAPDEPAPRKNAVNESALLDVPSPEALGLAAPKNKMSDDEWKQVHSQLTQQHAVCSQHLRLEDGSYRFIVILPTTQKDRVHHIEADGPTEAAAVRAALQKVGETK
jgi:hypothetical protein